MNDEAVEAIVNLANDPEFMKKVEPTIMQSLQLQNWMVRRTVEAILELGGKNDEREKQIRELKERLQKYEIMY